MGDGLKKLFADIDATLASRRGCLFRRITLYSVTPQSKALTPEQQKIQELEARIARLEREKSILKKATALLMSEEHERMR